MLAHARNARSASASMPAFLRESERVTHARVLRVSEGVKAKKGRARARKGGGKRERQALVRSGREIEERFAAFADRETGSAARGAPSLGTRPWDFSLSSEPQACLPGFEAVIWFLACHLVFNLSSGF